jgi:Ca2+-binding EF-hand superfamily protein
MRGVVRVQQGYIDGGDLAAVMQAMGEDLGEDEVSGMYNLTYYSYTYIFCRKLIAVSFLHQMLCHL